MGTVNIALNKKATATNYIAPYIPARAVDGNTSLGGSRWTCRVPGSLVIDLGTPNKVDQWSIQDISSNWGDPKYMNKKVDLSLSEDGEKWKYINSILNTDAQKIQIFPAENTRYARIEIATDNGLVCNNKIASVVNFNLYAASPTSNLLTEFVVTGNNGIVQAYTPKFNSNTTNYTSLVGADVTSVTIKPTASDAKAKIKINGVEVASGASSAAIALGLGINTITMAVEPYVGSINTYKLTITKESNNLSGLVVKNGNDVVPITPAFDKNTLTYTAAVANTVASVAIVPTVEDSSSTVTVNGNSLTSGQAIVNLVPGLNAISVVVKAKSGATKTYTVKVTQCSSYLSGLSIKDGANVVTYTPSFDSRTTLYNSNVANTVQSVQILPVLQDTTATVKVNGSSLTSGQATVNLNIGLNVIDITVTPTLGTAVSYKVNMIRTRVAYLTNLVLSCTDATAALNPSFNSEVFAYDYKVASGVTTVKFTPSAPAGCTIKVNNLGLIGGFRNIPISVLPFTIPVKVTNSDGSNITYNVTIKN